MSSSVAHMLFSSTSRLQQKGRLFNQKKKTVNVIDITVPKNTQKNFQDQKSFTKLKDENVSTRTSIRFSELQF